ncbi:substrate-binding domain-containing protein [Rhizobium leguminosarum]|nr:substrate-binding domain-containing protein [Rhizobium leguminosarum]
MTAPAASAPVCARACIRKPCGSTGWSRRTALAARSASPKKVRQGFTAFAALSDLHALRALTELQQAGINIPADVSVTGFDDLIWSPVVTPSLTTVRMDIERIAEIAVSALVDTIKTSGIREGVLVTAKIERVAMQLIVRQSSGPAKPAQKTSEMENM